MLTDEQAHQIVMAFYGMLITRHQDAHITVNDAIPDIARMVRDVDRLAIERCIELCEEFKETRASVMLRRSLLSRAGE